MLNADQQQRIIGALTERMQKKNRGFACPMCGNNHFTLLDSYIRNDVQASLETAVITLGGPTIPAAAIICDNCGFMSQHALGTLGLMPSRKEAKEPSKAEEPKGE